MSNETKETNKKENIGEREQNCLDEVKDCCFFDSSLSLVDNISLCDAYKYGFNNENNYDYEEIVSLLTTAINMDKITGQTKFPDFKCKDGLIEHFEISASGKKKDGYEYLINRGETCNNLPNRIEEDYKNQCLKSHYEENYYANQSYNEFEKNFISMWEGKIKKFFNRIFIIGRVD